MPGCGALRHLAGDRPDRGGRAGGPVRRHPRAGPTAPRPRLAFIDEYARLLLPPVLRLATRHGIGLEAHLQNCVPTFVDGVPAPAGLRDLAGMRLLPAAAAAAPAARCGRARSSCTDDVDVMRSKVAYTALQAHLGELMVRLVESHGLDEPAAWRAVRPVVDEVYDGLREPALAAGRDDHAFLTAPTVPHKALLRMRLAAPARRTGDIYVRRGESAAVTTTGPDVPDRGAPTALLATAVAPLRLRLRPGRRCVDTARGGAGRAAAPARRCCTR